MKCFVCSSRCHTIYLRKNADSNITAVASMCNECDWVSNPTSVPSSLPREPSS